MADTVKYIDAYAFRRYMDSLYPFTKHAQDTNSYYNIAKSQIVCALEVEPESIVRCKDCLHHDAGENECESWNYCKILARDVSDDWFCASGIKKNEE